MKNLINKKGWNTNSVVLLMKNFVETNQLESKLNEFSSQVVQDENENDDFILESFANNAIDQGWNIDSEKSILENFISSLDLDKSLVKFAKGSY